MSKDEKDPNAISDKQKSRENSSPVSGCLILSTIVAVFGGLVILYTVVGFYQFKKISGFTDETAAEIEVFEPTPDQITKADQRLSSVITAASGNTMDRVKFTADDLNTLIATREKLKDFRGTAFVRRISDEGIEVEMSQPVRQPGFGKPNRYLNATFVFMPEARARTIAFTIIDIRKEDRDVEIPEAFKKSFSAIDFYRLDPDDELMEPILRQMGKIYLEDEIIVVETKVSLNNN